MMNLPKYKAAVVQTAPEFLNIEKTVDKVISFMEETSRNGASIVAFPEVFISGYPYWNWTLTPVQGSAWFEKLYHASVALNGPELRRICEAAKKYNTFVVVGINEKGERLGEIYNTNVIISNKGEILGGHRKLVPTWAEKLTWTSGDGSSLKVYPSELGNIGTLACGENTNPLARYTLLAQNEQIHIANYISLPVAPEDYNMAEAIKIRAAAHSFEGKIHTLVSCSTITREMVESMGDSQAMEAFLTRKNSAFTGIIGPNGAPISEPLIDDEGIVYGEIDLNKGIQPKQMHDILGHYNRFDIFELRVHTAPTKNITFVNESQP